SPAATGSLCVAWQRAEQARKREHSCGHVVHREVSDNAVTTATHSRNQEAPMAKLRLVDAAGQLPSASERITIAIDVARTTWVYAVHWHGETRRDVRTPGALNHLQALVSEYAPTNPVRIVYEPCGFGY